MWVAFSKVLKTTVSEIVAVVKVVDSLLCDWGSISCNSCSLLIVFLSKGLSLCFMCTDQHVKYWMPRKFPLTSSLLLNYRFKSDVCSPKKHCFSRLNIFILRFFFCYRMAVLVLSFLIQTLYHLVTTILCDTEKLLFMMAAPRYQPFILTLNWALQLEARREIFWCTSVTGCQRLRSYLVKKFVVR